MNTRSSYALLNACKNDASKSIIALSFLYLSLYDNVSTNVTRAILNQTNDAENIFNGNFFKQNMLALVSLRVQSSFIQDINVLGAVSWPWVCGKVEINKSILAADFLNRTLDSKSFHDYLKSNQFSK